MYFENIDFSAYKLDLKQLTSIMENHGMVLAGQWDYERVTYDYRFEIKEGTYYLRIPGVAIEGDVGSGKAIIQTKKPYLGKHYYPHGVEYGEDEYFPEHLVKKCKEILSQIEQDLKTFSN